MANKDTCSYPGCKREKRVSLFRFPVHDKERFEKWIVNSGREDIRNLSMKVAANRRICQQHFSRKCMDVVHGKYKLWHNAVPLPIGTEPDEEYGDDKSVFSTATSDNVKEVTTICELNESPETIELESPFCSVNSDRKVACVNLFGNSDCDVRISDQVMVKACGMQDESSVSKVPSNIDDACGSSNEPDLTNFDEDTPQQASDCNNASEVITCQIGTQVDTVDRYFSLCRLCCSKDGKKHKVFNRLQGSLLTEILLKIQVLISPQAGIDVNLPHMVCDSCKIKLDQFYTFKEECRGAEQRLRRMFSHLQKERLRGLKYNGDGRNRYNEDSRNNASASAEVKNDIEVSEVWGESTLPERTDESVSDGEEMVQFIEDCDVQESDNMEVNDKFSMEHMLFYDSNFPPDDMEYYAHKGNNEELTSTGNVEDDGRKEKSCTGSKRTEETKTCDPLQSIENEKKRKGSDEVLKPKRTNKRWKELTGKSRKQIKDLIPRTDMHLLKCFSEQFKDVLLDKKKVKVRIVYADKNKVK